MMYIHAVPSWFCGYDAFVELIFSLVTLLVGIAAFKVYALTRKPASRLLGYSFIFISLSYLILAIYNFFLLADINTKICMVANISNVALFSALQMYLYLIFHMVGILILLYMTLKIQDTRVFILLVFLTLFSTIISFQSLFAAYILSSIYLLFIFHYFLGNFLRKPNCHTRLTMFAFGFLLIGNILFIFSFTHPAYYLVGHITKLIAYVMLLWNLVAIIRK